MVAATPANVAERSEVWTSQSVHAPSPARYWTSYVQLASALPRPRTRRTRSTTVWLFFVRFDTVKLLPNDPPTGVRKNAQPPLTASWKIKINGEGRTTARTVVGASGSVAKSSASRAVNRRNAFLPIVRLRDANTSRWRGSKEPERYPCTRIPAGSKAALMRAPIAAAIGSTGPRPPAPRTTGAVPPSDATRSRTRVSAVSSSHGIHA